MPLSLLWSLEPEAIVRLIERVVVGRAGLTSTTMRLNDVGQPLVVHAVWTPEPSRRSREIISVERPPGDKTRPMRTEAHAKLVPALTRAHRWLDELLKGAITLSELTEREALSPRTIRAVLSLAFVAPDIVTAALSDCRTKLSKPTEITASIPVSFEKSLRFEPVFTPKRVRRAGKMKNVARD